MGEPLEGLLDEVRACTLCQGLPLGPRPLLQASRDAKILIAGQAPGRKTHQKGIPFDDPSGDRLREWLGVSRAQFYDPRLFAIVPMGFCYPGTTSSGDLPPRPECAATWHGRLFAALPQVELRLIIGRFAMDWYLPALKKAPIHQAVGQWETTLPEVLALPHPSPRNNRWLKQHPWFEADVLPRLKTEVASRL